MSNDLANNKEPGQQGSVEAEISKAFDETSVCAVSTVLSIDNKNRKIFRSLVFLFFLIAFLYQFIAFLCYILEHPRVVDYEVLRDETFLAPAYTFCNFNPIKRSKFCAKFPRNCTRPDEDFCEDNPRFCGTPDTLILKEENFGVRSLEEFFLLNHDIEDLIGPVDDDEDKPVGPLPRLNAHEMETMVGACFSINDRVNSPLEPHMKGRSPFGNGMFDRHRFDPQENEVIHPETEAGIMFQVHSPFEPVNPFDTGYFMRPGYMYRINVKITKEERSYDCLNYTEVWLKNNKKGYRSEAACKLRCFQDLVVQCLNCSELAVLYPYPKQPFCTKYPDDHFKFTGICEHPEDEIVKCLKDCKEECVRMKYSYEVKESYQNRLARVIEKNESREILVKIEFLEDDMLKMVHKPQFQALEIFSLIGGFLAFWIGLSMFQIVEVFDCMLQVVRFLLKNKSAGTERPTA